MPAIMMLDGFSPPSMTDAERVSWQIARSLAGQAVADGETWYNQDTGLLTLRSGGAWKPLRSDIDLEGSYVTGTLPIDQGGTGATDAASALVALGAAEAVHTHSIDDIVDLPVELYEIIQGDYMLIAKDDVTREANVSVDLTALAAALDPLIGGTDLPISETDVSVNTTGSTILDPAVTTLAELVNDVDAKLVTIVAGAVPKASYDAQTVLVAVTDNTPTTVTIGEGQILGRIVGGNVGALSSGDINTILGSGAAYAAVGGFSGVNQAASISGIASLELVNNFTVTHDSDQFSTDPLKMGVGTALPIRLDMLLNTTAGGTDGVNPQTSFFLGPRAAGVQVEGIMRSMYFTRHVQPISFQNQIWTSNPSSQTIASATKSGSVGTVNLPAAHNAHVTGVGSHELKVRISGAVPVEWNGLWDIKTIVDADTLTIDATTIPGDMTTMGVLGFEIDWGGHGQAYIDNRHFLADGAFVSYDFFGTESRVPGGYEDNWQVLSFAYGHHDFFTNQVENVGYLSYPYAVLFGTTPKVLTALSMSSGTISGTTSTAHGFQVGDIIRIQRTSPVSFNNWWRVTATGTTTTFTAVAHSTFYGSAPPNGAATTLGRVATSSAVIWQRWAASIKPVDIANWGEVMNDGGIDIKYLSSGYLTNIGIRNASTYVTVPRDVTVVAGDTVSEYAEYIRLTSASNVTLANPSLAPGQLDGERKTIVNAGTANITLQGISGPNGSTTAILYGQQGMQFVWRTLVNAWQPLTTGSKFYGQSVTVDSVSTDSRFYLDDDEFAYYGDKDDANPVFGYSRGLATLFWGPGGGPGVDVSLTRSAAGTLQVGATLLMAAGAASPINLNASNLYGDDASGGHLLLNATSHATKGQIKMVDDALLQGDLYVDRTRPDIAHGFLRRRYQEFYEDFWGTNTTSGTIGTYGWTFVVANSATVTAAAGTVALATVAASGAATLVGTSMVEGGVDFDWEWILSLPALATVNTQDYEIYVGWGNTTNAEPTTGYYFKYDVDTSANWQTVTANGGSRTAKTSSTAYATGAHRFRVERRGTTVTFYIDDVLVGTHSNENNPAGLTSYNPQLTIVKEAGATNRTVTADAHYFVIRQGR